MADGSGSGYGASAAPVSNSTSGVQWVSVMRDQRLPKDALRAGWTPKDGPVYVGIGTSKDTREVGKINLQDVGKIELVEEPHMYNFWPHGFWDGEKSARVLVCGESVVPVWTYISSGEPLPANAVKVADAIQADAGGNWGMGLATNFMTKIGLQEKQGALYVGRFNGEPGAMEVNAGLVSSFWSHIWGEQSTAEILTLGEASEINPNLTLGEASEVSNVPQDEQKLRIKVLQFNIWQEGWEVSGGLEKIADVIILSGADVVTLSEVRNWYAKYVLKPHTDFHVRLIKALKARMPSVTFYGSWVEGCDTGFVSKFPVEYAESVTNAKRSIISMHRIRTPAGPLCVYSAHLDWKNYALNLVRGYGADDFKKMECPVTDVEALHEMDGQSGRNQALKDFVKHAKEQTCPVLLGGDFNECSHLDWTEATKDMHGHAGVAIEWRHSKLLQEAGHTDSWRELYPDPTTHMGATWPSEACGKECTSWAVEADERDRIDFIYHSSSARSRLCPTAGHIVGSKGYFIFGQPVDVTSESDASPFLPATLDCPWPSDHKAVLVEYELETVS